MAQKPNLILTAYNLHKAGQTEPACILAQVWTDLNVFFATETLYDKDRSEMTLRKGTSCMSGPYTELVLYMTKIGTVVITHDNHSLRIRHDATGNNGRAREYLTYSSLCEELGRILAYVPLT